jgi:hypothetical protein
VHLVGTAATAAVVGGLVLNDLKKRRVLTHMIAHQDSNPPALMPRLTGLESGGALDKTVVGRIVIEELTGKKSAEVDF